MIETRLEKPGDEGAIRLVNEQAFGGAAEANLIDALRERNGCVLSMVAVENSQIVGHILFCLVTIGNADPPFQAVGLGPMAILPSHQRKGIGSQLLKEGLDECRRGGYDVAVVVGHADFYTRFGFVPAKKRNLQCEFDAPEDAFMVLELRENALEGIEGLVRYPPEFRQV
jgi:putative acetyltransferase